MMRRIAAFTLGIALMEAVNETLRVLDLPPLF